MSQQNLMDVNSQLLNNTVLSWPTCELKANSHYKLNGSVEYD